MSSIAAINYFGFDLGRKLLFGKKNIFVLGSGKFAKEFLLANNYIKYFTVIYQYSSKIGPSFPKSRSVLHVDDAKNLPVDAIYLVLTKDEHLINSFKNLNPNCVLIYPPIYSARWVDICLPEILVSTLKRDLGQRSLCDLTLNLGKQCPLVIDLLYRGSIRRLEACLLKLSETLVQNNFNEQEMFRVRIIPSHNLGYFNEVPVFTKLAFECFFSSYCKENSENALFLFLYRALFWGDFNIACYSEFPKLLSRQLGLKLPVEKYQDESIVLSGFMADDRGMPIDLCRKWKSLNSSRPSLPSLSLRICDFNNKCVFIVRRSMRGHDHLLDHLLKVLRSHGARQVRLYHLTESQVQALKFKARGGYWDDYGIGGGDPDYAISFVYDRPLSPQHVKESFRRFCSTNCPSVMNPVHSTDDNYEAHHYLSLINMKEGDCL